MNTQNHIMKQWKLSIFFRVRSKLYKLFLKIAKALEIKSKVFDDLPETSLIAYRCFGFLINDMFPLDISQTNDSSIKPLPDSIFISPGLYCIDRKFFDLKQDGLYRFYALGRLSEQRIVCQEGIDSLLKILGYLWKHGNYDAKINGSLLRKELLYRIVSIHCGISSFLCHNLLQECGYRSRVVICLTTEVWNQHDNGHTMVEVFHANLGWIVYDQSFSCLFKAQEDCLSLINLVEIIKENRPYQIEFLTKSEKSSLFQDYGFDYGFWVEHRILSEFALRNWYNRVLNIPMIYDDKGENFYFTGSQQVNTFVQNIDKRLFGYQTTYLSQNDFNLKFYENQA